MPCCGSRSAGTEHTPRPAPSGQAYSQPRPMENLMPDQSRSIPRRALLLALGLLGGAPALSAYAAPPLPALNIDITQTSISGISSGGFMTVQFQVAHSSIVKGAGVVAGGPFNCSKGDGFRAVASCSCTGEPSVHCAVTESSADISSLVTGAEEMARQGLIDPTQNLAGQRILTVSGAKDTLVPPAIAHQLSRSEEHTSELQSPLNLVC